MASEIDRVLTRTGVRLEIKLEKKVRVPDPNAGDAVEDSRELFARIKGLFARTGVCPKTGRRYVVSSRW